MRVGLWLQQLHQKPGALDLRWTFLVDFSSVCFCTLFLSSWCRSHPLGPLPLVPVINEAESRPLILIQRGSSETLRCIYIRTSLCNLLLIYSFLLLSNCRVDFLGHSKSFRIRGRKNEKDVHNWPPSKVDQII